MSAPVILAVDGGNSKTDLALVRADGGLVSLVRGPGSSPHHLGLEGGLTVLGTLLDEAARELELPVAAAELLMAGVDFPVEEETLREAVLARGWATRVTVRNDTFAVLRAGTDRGWGVAVVCGAGINCVGVAPDGRHARFPALGPITGDWGGGQDVGLAAVFAAARSEDGRGPRTSLEQAVPAHFGLETPSELAEAIHMGRIPQARVVELPPVVLEKAASDPVAAEIVARLADEIVALVRAALARLDLTREPVEVVLGGGVLQARDPRLLGAIEDGLQELGPRLTVRLAESPPVVGAALLGLDELGADGEASARLRSELGAAVGRLDESTTAVLEPAGD
ncbi:MAG TPA: BadF/BadG/BcrA/BcrD ATPase family protein [Gaiellaceae bacterium]|nr:BadF/BadG/BcrA/BcrD ATPase family protein [Gaiellaceae bacterium]